MRLEEAANNLSESILEEKSMEEVKQRYSEYIDIYRSIKQHKEVQMKELNSLFFIYHTYINKKEVKA